MNLLLKRVLTAITCLSLNCGLMEAYDCCGGEVHGFVSQGVIKSTDNKYFGNSDDFMFDFHEVGINYCVEPCCDLWAGIQFFARDLGDIGNNEIIIDWAFLEYYINDLISIRAGKVKLPLALYNKSRDADVARTWIFYPQSVYNELFRGFSVAHWGVAIFGNVCLPECLGSLDYEVTIGTFELDEDEKLLRDNRQLIRSQLMVHTLQDNRVDVDYSFASQVIWNTPIDCLRVGGSYGAARICQKSNYPSLHVAGTQGTVRTESELNLAAVFGEWVHDCLTVTGEALWIKVPSDLYIVAAPGYPTVTNGSPKIDHLGYYLMAEYCVSDCITIGGYYAVNYPNQEDKGSTVFQYQRDYDATIRWDINDCLVAKFEYHHFVGAANLSKIDNNYTADRTWDMVAGKLSVAF